MGEPRSSSGFSPNPVRFYEDLARADATPPLPEPSTSIRGEFDRRVGRRGRTAPLDTLLTEFGLSPHPRVLVIVEGATEAVLLPRTMRALGMPIDDDHIRIVDREGARRDIDALVAFAVTPRIDDDERTGYVTLTRPTTRLLVVTDPHAPFDTQEQRERAKGK